MIRRTFDAARINYIANHPTVRPFIGGDINAPLDLAPVIANPDHVFLEGEHGGFCCSWTGPGDYEIHTFVLPEGRGPWAARFAREGKEYMIGHGAKHLWTRVLPEARNVRAFTLRAGFKPAGRNIVDLGQGPVTYDLFDWRA